MPFAGHSHTGAQYCLEDKDCNGGVGQFCAVIGTDSICAFNPPDDCWPLISANPFTIQDDGSYGYEGYDM